MRLEKEKPDMKRIAILMLVTVFAVSAFAQKQDFTKKGDSDPAATAILKKVKTKYDAFSSVEVDFTLDIEFPEEPVETQKGSLIQSGEKYRLQSEYQDIYCDGTAVWLYLKNNQEVQINNIDTEDEGSFLSPRDFLRVYENADHVYALTNEIVEGGRIIQQIEFKPLDEDSEYSKMRLTIDKGKNEIKRLKVFGRDGSRYTITVDRMIANKSYAAGTFAWKDSICSDCYVEDLRID